jgi:sugar/nucleoside kinase (ribokinase family)
MMQSRPRRLFSVGSILVDIRVEVPSLPERGGDVLASAAALVTGGGFNILAAAARNGLPAAFAGHHGTGAYGNRIRADLAREGIDVLLPATLHGDSGFCLVMVEPDGERTFVTSPGVEAHAKDRSLADIVLQDQDAVFASGYDLCYPELGSAIGAWSFTLPADLTFVLDPGPLVGEIPTPILTSVLSRVDILTMNHREASILDRSGDMSSIFELILPRLRPGALLIVRKGKDGCTLGGVPLSDERVHVPAPAVRMVDSTGAGDAHTGVFIASLAHGLDSVSAAVRANAAAALAVTKLGSATAPTSRELDAFLATQHDPLGKTIQQGSARPLRNEETSS